ncbi:MAG: glycosyltransferase family 2 protein [Candidatus Magasanikbacteria bacterium]|nr:glycosyltransferase family 2 protein [Candidatus Magasanikbacteria bacterium]
MVDISIVIVNYNSKDFTLNCVKSILASDWSGLSYEIIVVDNNSGDGVGELLQSEKLAVKFIQSSENNGMGAGNNIGFKVAQGKYFVAINPDTLVATDTFKILFDYMEKNSDVGVVAPQLLNPDKTIQNSCFRWYSLLTPVYRRLPLDKFKFAQKDIDRFLMADYDRKKMREVDWLMGSFLFCRAEVLKKINYFDERYFMYFEDTDLCRTFWKEGWRVVYFPEAKVIHNHARESAEKAWYMFISSKSTRGHIYSWLKYLLKWGPGLPKSN